MAPPVAARESSPQSPSLAPRRSRPPSEGARWRETTMRLSYWTRRIAYVLSLGTVTGVAALASYSHQVDVALLAHQASLLAHTLPLSIDGMLIVATLAMSEDKANGLRPRGWARFGFWLGAGLSVTANVTATAVHYGDPISIGGSVVAPVILLVCVEITARPGKPRKVGTSGAAPAAVRVVPEPVVQAEQVVAAEVTRLPAPVSPAPQRADVERVRVDRSGPVARRPAISPLTQRVLTDRPPIA